MSLDSIEARADGRGPRETYGISHVTVSVRVDEAFAPVVERLTGT